MELDRRNFLKGAAVAGGAAALAGLAGCAPAAQENTATPQTDSEGTPSSSWRTAPAEITDDQIAETFEADLVVVGAGNAGCVAAVSAVEDGASVILLQKEDIAFCHGNVFAANGTSAQKEAGIEIDGWEVINSIDLTSENRAKTDVLRNWVKYSSEVGDWLTEKINAMGMGPVVVDVPEEADDEWNQVYAVTHRIMGEGVTAGKMPVVVQHLLDDADQNLLDVHYSTPAVQLRKNENGRVTGVIAQREDESYILCNATKAVILAAGSYGNDLEMRDELMPFAKGLPSGYSRPSDTGDGIKMGYWIGGAIQSIPHACNIHYDPSINYPEYRGTLVPWLRVNKNGERFSNEDRPYELIYAKDMTQPGCMHFQVFDDDYATDIEGMGRGGNMRGVWTEIVPQALEANDLYTGNTLEELAEAMGVPAEAFVATVERYNELAEKGYDEDFGKQATRLKALDKPPFYAFARQATCLTPLCGLEINGDMQVLDEEGNVIEGLYAAGNNSGNFFGGLIQRMNAGGMGVGRAILTGRVAEKRALGIDY